MKKINLIFIVFLVLIFSSCSKKQDSLKIDETVYVRFQGADMPVYMHGNLNSNVILLIVHGGPGGNGLQYRYGMWTVELEQKYLVAYWDQRGQGMAQGHYSEDKLTIRQMADDMNAVIEALKAKYGSQMSVVALGHSWGGTLTSKFVTIDEYQQKLKGWIEFDGAHDMPKNDIESLKLFTVVANEQIAEGNSVDKWQEILDWVPTVDTTNITYEVSAEINKRGFEAENWLYYDGMLAKEEGGGNPWPGYTSQINPLTNYWSGMIVTNTALSDENSKYSATNQLYKVDIPCLFIWGKYDFVVPPSLGYDAYNTVSSTNKKFVLLEKSGHSGMAGEWEKTDESIIDFIETIK